MVGTLEKERVFLIDKQHIRQFNDTKLYNLIKDYYMTSYYLTASNNIEVRAVEIVDKKSTIYRLDTKIRTENDGKGWKESKKIYSLLNSTGFKDITKNLIPIHKHHKVYLNIKTNEELCLMEIDNGVMYLVEVESDDPLSIDTSYIVGKEVTNDKYYYMSEYWKRKKESKY